jgi:hypothetical protein
MSGVGAPRGISPLRRLREREWSPVDRTMVIALLAIVFGCLFLLTYSLALGDPVPRRIDAALVGNPAAAPRTVDAVEGVAGGKLDFRRYASVPAALQAIDEQRVYATLDLTSSRPTLYVASAAGASVARVLERIYPVDPAVGVVDTHPLQARDPNGLDVFYRMLVATIIGNTSSGGAVSPPLLPAPFAFISQWLPSGATVTALRDAVYFSDHQHVHPIAVLAVWATGLFAAWLVVAHRRQAATT